MKRRVFRVLAAALALLLCGVALAEVRTTGSVWLRKGPGLKYEQVTSYAEGKSLTYLGQSSVDDRGVTWYYVSDGKNTGWVSSMYTTLKGEGERLVNATDAAQPTATPAPTATPMLPALEAGQLFVDSLPARDGAARPAREDVLELSPYYLENLVTAANEIGLVSYREVMSEVPYQYYDGALIIAGNQQVENIVIYGEGYELFGAAVGMPLNQAAACMIAAGLDYLPTDTGATFLHKGGELSLFVDEDGYDSCINLQTGEDGAVMLIDWSSFTG